MERKLTSNSSNSSQHILTNTTTLLLSLDIQAHCRWRRICCICRLIIDTHIFRNLAVDKLSLRARAVGHSRYTGTRVDVSPGCAFGSGQSSCTQGIDESVANPGRICALRTERDLQIGDGGDGQKLGFQFDVVCFALSAFVAYSDHLVEEFLDLEASDVDNFLGNCGVLAACLDVNEEGLTSEPEVTLGIPSLLCALCEWVDVYRGRAWDGRARGRCQKSAEDEIAVMHL